MKSGHRYILPILSVNRNFQKARKYNTKYSNIESTFEKDVKLPVIAIENEDHQYEEDVKLCILENALKFVNEKGWSVATLSAGAEAAGYPGITHGLFPNGSGDLVHFFNIKCNEELVRQMKTVSFLKITYFDITFTSLIK